VRVLGTIKGEDDPTISVRNKKGGMEHRLNWGGGERGQRDRKRAHTLWESLVCWEMTRKISTRIHQKEGKTTKPHHNRGNWGGEQSKHQISCNVARKRQTCKKKESVVQDENVAGGQGV